MRMVGSGLSSQSYNEKLWKVETFGLELLAVRWIIGCGMWIVLGVVAVIVLSVEENAGSGEAAHSFQCR